MNKITLGIKDKNIKYDFRETCFGIYIKDGKLLLTTDKKYNQYTLVGGGVQENENKHDALKREFIEEVGLKIKNIKYFVTIDCFWMAGGLHPIESLAHFCFIDIDKKLDVESEGEIEFVDLDKIKLPLPYQQKVIELLKKN